MDAIKNNVIRQIVILLLIAFLGIVIVWKLSYFIPGFLGSAALYIMFRSWYFKLTEKRKWKKWLAATTLILGLLVAMVGPVYLMVEVLTPKINTVLSNTDNIKNNVLKVYAYVQEKVPQVSISQQQVLGFVQKGVGILPLILNATANLFANIFTALFIFYFLLMGGRAMEAAFRSYIPLARRSRQEVWKETQNLVISNAIGIPFLALCQGLVAILAYWFCGIEGAVLWGALTGFATIIPVIGTMVVWVPVCIYLLAKGETNYAIGLALYCFIIVGSTDNVIRFLFLKKFGDVHPLITVFGVILGLNLFGIVGLIFGPLVLSYFLMLIRIYRAEYGEHEEALPERGGDS
ncbi:AI-2E family transporter [Taibaiella sp. KBW10]|uniref:AI-2E family transporter n=1 Tax=Taibaiella sp. KBW10 TaxID=2153357 RepID=UPI000F5B5A77|nr:AI-2E family transporter [Taibaiella sp. KBW10]RQO32609.1 AI-2E family transporter [Taibaiella sp. KBW10]